MRCFHESKTEWKSKIIPIIILTIHLLFIGTAADIIEFFDSFKDDKIAAEPVLVLLTLAIWYYHKCPFENVDQTNEYISGLGA